MTHKYDLYSYLLLFLDPNICVNICLIISVASKFIQILVCPILGYPNIFWYFSGPIWCVFLINADNFWPTWTIYDQFESVLNYFSEDTKIWMINIPIISLHISNLLILWLFPGLKIFGCFGQIMGIWIYLDICSVKLWTSEYIQIFVRSIRCIWSR